jgi:hypothetical protein
MMKKFMEKLRKKGSTAIEILEIGSKGRADRRTIL